MKYFSNFNILNCLNSEHLANLFLQFSSYFAAAATVDHSRAMMMIAKANTSERDYRKILKIFSTYLVVNFFISLLLIAVRFHMTASNILFTVISISLPLISLVETYAHYEKCLKFLEIACEIKSQLISRRILIKTFLVLSVIIVQVAGIFLRHFLNSK